MIRTIFVALALVLVPFTAYAQPAPQDAVEGLTEPVSEVQLTTQPPVVNPAPAEEKGSDFSGILQSIQETIITILTAVITGAAAWLAGKVTVWTNGRIKLDEVVRDSHMEGYARGAVEKAFAFALARAGVSWDAISNVQIKNQVLRFAVDFLLSQYPEVVKWVDKDNNGLIDWVETMLPGWATLPPPATPAPASESLGLIGEAKPKTTRKPRAKKDPGLNIPASFNKPEGATA